MVYRCPFNASRAIDAHTHTLHKYPAETIITCAYLSDRYRGKQTNAMKTVNARIMHQQRKHASVERCRFASDQL